MLLTQRAKAHEAGMKGFGRAVVGIVVEALILPKRIYALRNVMLPSA
jgi:hypothetical protein